MDMPLMAGRGCIFMSAYISRPLGVSASLPSTYSPCSSSRISVHTPMGVKDSALMSQPPCCESMAGQTPDVLKSAMVLVNAPLAITSP